MRAGRHVHGHPDSARFGIALMALSALAYSVALPAAKWSLVALTPLQTLFWSRVVAATVSLPLLLRSRPPSSPRRRAALAPGIVLGALLFTTFLLVLLGLESTPASTAGVIISVHIVATPLLAGLVLKEKPSGANLLAALICMAGVVIVSAGPSGIAHGTLLLLGAALVIPFHTVTLARAVRRAAPPDLVMVQSVTSAILAATAGLGQLAVPDALSVAPALLLGGTVPGLLAAVAQGVAQRTVSAATTALILALEPVGAATLAIAFLGESLTPGLVIGGGIVVAGTVVGGRAELARGRRPER